jgi:ABC-type lipoprotein export system ATPase subunit
MNIVVWTILAYYFDRIIPNENGYAEHPLFFLLPKRFLISQSRNTDQILLPQDAEDDDVVAERETVTNYLSQNSDLSDVGLVISGLHKVWQHFDPIFRWKRKQLRANTEARKVALQELSLSVQKGELLALLGSNGAGKTTAMKILYGSSSPTAGNAWLFGNDIQKDVSKIHQILGVCPQFDVLFPDLTAKEHLELFGGIKGLSKETLQLVSEERLKHMRLWKVRNQRAGQFSGGMRRRLSVIISTMGDPKCLFLDEPTSK